MADPGHIAGPIVIPNCVEVDLRWELANAKVVHNVLHGIVAGGFAATSTIAEAIRTAITSGAQWTNYAAELNSAVSLLAVALRDLRTANEPLVDSTGAPVSGTAAVKALPPEVALAVTLRTANAGRAFRGRVYLPGFDSSAMNADGTATAGCLTDAQAFVAHVQAGMAASGVTMAIAQPARAAYTGPRSGVAHAARAANAVPVTAILVRDAVFDSQRRRSR